MLNLIDRHCVTTYAFYIGYNVNFILVTCQSSNNGYIKRVKLMTNQTQSSRVATAKFIGGVLFLDFINSIDARVKISSSESLIETDKLNNYEDLLIWSERAKILSNAEIEALKRESQKNGDVTANILKRAIDLRESLYSICLNLLTGAKLTEIDLKVVNDEFQIAQGNRRLEEKNKKLFWAWKKSPLEFDKMLWAITQSAADYFARGDYSHLRECGNEKCGWLFEDTSRNRRRNWCDMQDCGNLNKVRRFRARVAKK